jgi:uncharacterized cupredoxin-like copper-binding protein
MRAFGGFGRCSQLGCCVGLVGLAFAASACGSAETEVPIAISDFAFEPKQITIERGKKSVLVLQNKGAVEHNLSIQRQPIASQMVQPGQTVRMDIQLPPGNYPFICTVPGHEEAGMTGQITSARGR